MASFPPHTPCARTHMQLILEVFSHVSIIRQPEPLCPSVCSLFGDYSMRFDLIFTKGCLLISIWLFIRKRKMALSYPGWWHIISKSVTNWLSCFPTHLSLVNSFWSGEMSNYHYLMMLGKSERWALNSQNYYCTITMPCLLMQPQNFQTAATPVFRDWLFRIRRSLRKYWKQSALLTVILHRGN